MDSKTGPKTRVFFDMHFPEWQKLGVANNFDIDELSTSLINSHADSVILFAKCQYGNAYYDTEIGHKHQGLGAVDFLRRMTEKLHAGGKEVIAYYSIAWDEFQAGLHPEWLTKDSAGSSESDEFRWKTLCINSPYRGFVREQLAEIAKNTGVDGFWIDMTIIGSDRCHCQYCTEKFLKNRTVVDKELKSNDVSANDDLLFLNFQYDYIEEFYRETFQMLRQINPDLILMNNYWGYPYSPKSMGSRAVGAQKGVDMLTGEAYTDWTGLEAPEYFSRFLRSVAQGRPFEVLLGRFVNTWDFTRKPFDQLFFECMTVFSHGGVVTIDDQPFYDGTFDQNLYENDLSRIFSTIDRYRYTLEGSRYKYAAVYHSQRTKDIEDQKEFIKEMTGAYRIFRDAHIPVDFLFDENECQELLDEYSVIFLPSVHTLDSNSIERLLAYIEKGGMVIATGSCALAPSFKLIDDGCNDKSVSYILDKDDKSMEYLLVRGTYHRYRKEDTDRKERFQLIEPIVETDKVCFYHNNLPSPYREAGYPVRLEMRKGRGICVFYNQPLARSYAKQPSPGIRQMVLNQVYSVQDNAKYILKAPKRVSSEYYENFEKKTSFIHLAVAGAETSLSCGLLDTMQGNFERPFVYMEQCDRVSNIDIELCTNRYVRSIASIHENNAVAWEQDKSTITIKVDGITLWDVLEVVYE